MPEPVPTDPPHVPPWIAFRRTLFHFDAGKIAPEIAIRNTIGFLAAVILATRFGSPSAGAVAGIGALNVSYSDSRDPYIVRARRMLLSSALCGLAVALGSLAGHNNVVAVLAATAWAFGSGMLVALGTTAGNLGVTTLVTLVVFAARPMPFLEALETALLATAGGLIETLLALAFWPIRPYQPERRIVAALYTALASVARAPGLPLSAPPMSRQISEAQEAFTELGRDRAPEAERLVYLLNQAERIRLSLLTLGRLSRRTARVEQGRAAARSLVQVLQAAALTLESVSRAALEGKPAGDVAEFTSAARAFRKTDWGEGQASASRFFAALIRDARLQVDALGGQLRSTSGIVSQTALRSPTRDSWKLRFTGRLAKLQANLSLHSTVFRHALRLAVTLGIGDALGRALSIERTYWLPMTIAIILKPDFTTTVSRGVMRLAGTFAGLVLATAIFHFAHTGIAADIALMGVFTFLLRWLGPANYGIFVTALSAMIVLLVAVTGVAPKDVIVARAINTAAGGVLSMLAYALWPTWEKTQVGAALADMIDGYRAYFRAVIAACTGTPVPDIDRVRLQSRRARSNAEASVDRTSCEPGIAPRERNALNAILVNSHSLAHAAMALEAGLDRTKTAPPRSAALVFAEQVDLTLAAASDALRHRTPMSGDLPDLREAHNRILEAPEAQADRYALVNVETDRITTSVNTLHEQIDAWIALGSKRIGPA
ncbi:MAG: FUSC family protein [Bryobacteraceae bacterium]|jgi:uncharacterized membrane protein YccC